MALLVRTMFAPFSGLVPDWQQILVFVSIASMALGAFAAIGQTNIKRLLAYSSIENIGIIYAGAGLAIIFHAYNNPHLAALALVATRGRAATLAAQARRARPGACVWIHTSSLPSRGTAVAAKGSSDA